MLLLTAKRVLEKQIIRSIVKEFYELQRKIAPALLNLRFMHYCFLEDAAAINTKGHVSYSVHLPALLQVNAMGYDSINVDEFYEFQSDIAPSLSRLMFQNCSVKDVAINTKGHVNRSVHSPALLQVNAIGYGSINVDKFYEFQSDIDPALSRLIFHDCFVKRCDTSILLDPTASIVSEEVAPPKESLKGFDIIGIINLEAEEACHGVVSCVDTDVLAARESLVLMAYDLPAPKDDINTTADHLFGLEGFDDRGTVTLIGYGSPHFRTTTTGGSSSSSSRGGGSCSSGRTARGRGRTARGSSGSGVGSSGNGGDEEEDKEDGHHDAPAVDSDEICEDIDEEKSEHDEDPNDEVNTSDEGYSCERENDNDDDEEHDSEETRAEEQERELRKVQAEQRKQDRLDKEAEERDAKMREKKVQLSKIIEEFSPSEEEEEPSDPEDARIARNMKRRAKLEKAEEIYQDRREQ